MKKLLSLLFTLCLLFTVLSACGQQSGGSELDKNSIIGVWSIDNTALTKAVNPINDALSGMLEEYFSSANTIEFKEGGKVLVGNSEADYSIEGKKLTLIWNDSQNFVMDTVQSGDTLKLSFQGCFDVDLTRVRQ